MALYVTCKHPFKNNNKYQSNTALHYQNTVTATCFGSQQAIFRLYTRIYKQKYIEKYAAIYSQNLGLNLAETWSRGCVLQVFRGPICILHIKRNGANHVLRLGKSCGKHMYRSLSTQCIYVFRVIE